MFKLLVIHIYWKICSNVIIIATDCRLIDATTITNMLSKLRLFSICLLMISYHLLVLWGPLEKEFL